MDKQLIQYEHVITSRIFLFETNYHLIYLQFERHFLFFLKIYHPVLTLEFFPSIGVIVIGLTAQLHCL